MRTLMRQVHNKIGVTSLYVTHDQLEAMVLSDRVCVMDQGVLIQTGTPLEVFNRPSSVFVAEFLGAANILNITHLDHESGLVTLGSDVTLQVAHWPNSGVIKPIEALKLVIRHHHFKLIGSQTSPREIGQKAVNHFQAQVMSKIFLGERIRYEFKIGQNLKLIAELPAMDEGPEVNSHVWVELDPNHCLVL
jgi:ABC-type Fe3+/spermidine/putrescine transport system ATPase subunit